MELLTQAFYARGAEEVAQELLGKYLVHHSLTGEQTAGLVVETEAYLSTGDPACHAARGQTPRNRVMFGPPGKTYIYFTYGMHYCFNVVTAQTGIAEAVLIRALQPVTGIELMQARRGKTDIKQLCSGPAKLAQAMGFTLELNESDLVNGPIRFYTNPPNPDPLNAKQANLETPEIVATPRIGISSGQDLLLRFYLAGSSWISRK